MQTDTVKLLASTLTAVILVLGGSLLLVYVWMQPVEGGKEGVMALLAGFIGFAIQFLFGQNDRVGAVRAYERGLNTPAPATVP